MIALGFFSLALLGLVTAGYWSRPDSYLLIFVCAALAITESYRDQPLSYLRFFLQGVLCGLAVDAKAHAVLYFIPVFFEARARWTVREFFSATAVILVGSLLGAASLLCAAGSFICRISCMVAECDSTRVGACAVHRQFSVTWRPWLLILALACGRKNLSFVVCASMVLLAAIVASKPGSYPTHFIPFLPTMLVIFARSLAQPAIAARAKIPVALVIVGAFYRARQRCVDG